MRKVIIAPIKNTSGTVRESWLDLDNLAVVQVTSEEDGYPIESAFAADGTGWRASDKGVQTIRLVFDKPQRITRIWLVFEETENDRTQEFILRWASAKGNEFREIVRQQWNFSPPDSSRETENYVVDLPDVTILELVIVPDNRGGEARASLFKLLLT